MAVFRDITLNFAGAFFPAFRHRAGRLSRDERLARVLKAIRRFSFACADVSSMHHEMTATDIRRRAGAVLRDGESGGDVKERIQCDEEERRVDDRQNADNEPPMARERYGNAHHQCHQER